MTWSIVARDPATGAFGVAVTSKFFAVGAVCSHARSGVGALSTQALVNPTYGARGLRLLGEGVPAPEAMRILLEADAGRETRQLHMIDAAGRGAAHTGRDCVGWCGHVLREGFSVAGNMLAGPAVVERTAAVFAETAAHPFAERFLAALDAGQAVGGDKRGKQSAVLLVYAGEEYPALDLRVDDHAEPLLELRRLYGVAQEHFVHFMRFMPTRQSPTGTYDRDLINAEIARIQAERR
ncbi:MAG TPA: DUF1028 domain-containing protein [Stellaceae bacterium]|nr:DUF1028 domain-containing protein [Stellaceae bacterium]